MGMQKNGLISSSKNPFKELIASVSVGIYNNDIILDLDYLEDSKAQTDLNVVMNESGKFIEVQGTAESKAFSMEELSAMLKLTTNGISNLFIKQKLCLGIS
jgi:ribonuclease PH